MLWSQCLPLPWWVWVHWIPLKVQQLPLPRILRIPALRSRILILPQILPQARKAQQLHRKRALCLLPVEAALLPIIPTPAWITYWVRYSHFFRLITVPGPYMYVILQKIPKVPSMIRRCRLPVWSSCISWVLYMKIMTVFPQLTEKKPWITTWIPWSQSVIMTRQTSLSTVSEAVMTQPEWRVSINSARIMDTPTLPWDVSFLQIIPMEIITPL